MTWPTYRRRAAEGLKDDEACNQTLKDLVKIRADKINQVTELLKKVSDSNCTKTSRRLRRIMRDKRILQAVSKCDESEKAVKLTLANLTLSAASGIMSLVVVGFAALAAMFI